MTGVPRESESDGVRAEREADATPAPREGGQTAPDTEASAPTAGGTADASTADAAPASSAESGAADAPADAAAGDPPATDVPATDAKDGGQGGEPDGATTSDAGNSPSDGAASGATDTSADGGANRGGPRRPGPHDVPRPPRRLRHGLKLRGREAPRAEHPIAQRWLALLPQDQMDPEEADEAFKYARAGQTASLEFPPGGPDARVQGHRGKPYRVRISVPTWSREQRRQIAEALADEAASLAALLEGRIPDGLDEMLAGLGLTLLPTTLEATCECKRPAPCRHVGAVMMLVAERIDDDPLLLFGLRGMPADQLLEQLRQLRALRARGSVTAHPDPDVPEARQEVAPLSSAVDHFWRPSAGRVELAATSLGKHADHALLRRLGSSPLGGRFPLVGLLASIYDSVTESVRQDRDEADTWAMRDDEDESTSDDVTSDDAAAGDPSAGEDDGDAASGAQAAGGSDASAAADDSKDDASATPSSVGGVRTDAAPTAPPRMGRATARPARAAKAMPRARRRDPDRDS